MYVYTCTCSLLSLCTTACAVPAILFVQWALSGMQPEPQAGDFFVRRAVLAWIGSTAGSQRIHPSEVGGRKEGR